MEQGRKKSPLFQKKFLTNKEGGCIISIVKEVIAWQN